MYIIFLLYPNIWVWSTMVIPVKETSVLQPQVAECLNKPMKSWNQWTIPLFCWVKSQFYSMLCTNLLVYPMKSYEITIFYHFVLWFHRLFLGGQLFVNSETQHGFRRRVHLDSLPGSGTRVVILGHMFLQQTVMMAQWFKLWPTTWRDYSKSQWFEVSGLGWEGEMPRNYFPTSMGLIRWC